MVGWLTLEACKHVTGQLRTLSRLSPALAQPPSPSCFNLSPPSRPPARTHARHRHWQFRRSLQNSKLLWNRRGSSLEVTLSTGHPP